MRTVILFGIACIALTLPSASSATDIYREPWHWSSDLPAAVISAKPRSTVRERAAFERFHFRERTTMRDIVAAFGLPDAFASQFPVTRAEGVPVSYVHGGPEAGTFRYILRDGGEFLITVSDFRTITGVTRYQKQIQHTIYTKQ